MTWKTKKQRITEELERIWCAEDYARDCDHDQPGYIAHGKPVVFIRDADVRRYLEQLLSD